MEVDGLGNVRMGGLVLYCGGGGGGGMGDGLEFEMVVNFRLNYGVLMGIILLEVNVWVGLE